MPIDFGWNLLAVDDLDIIFCLSIFCCCCWGFGFWRNKASNMSVIRVCMLLWDKRKNFDWKNIGFVRGSFFFFFVCGMFEDFYQCIFYLEMSVSGLHLWCFALLNCDFILIVQRNHWYSPINSRLIDSCSIRWGCLSVTNEDI